ncbi:MAG TPA: glycosyltransferase family 2 protein [Gemmataceae bacterium]|nr:glycosyltransferase family 2 protein [Gemmataceae bacterium]
MDTPGISVIIPTYNRAHLLPRAIRSALAAMLPQDEIVVADDASTDNTADMIKEFGDRVRYRKFPHGGAGVARNHALSMATMPLVAFLDSDDEWDADKLTLQRNLLARRPDVLFCFSNFCSRLESGEVTHNFLEQWHRDPRGWDEILGPGVPYASLAQLTKGRADFKVHIGSMYLQEMESDYVATSTVLVRREEAGAALRFADDICVSEDKECFGRLAGAGLGAYLDCETSVQWGHGGPRVTDVDIYALASARVLLLDRIWGSDPAFVAQHGDRLEKCRREQRIKRARWLVVRGRTREARADLREAGSCPLSLKMLAALPGPMARGLLKVRRLVRGER